MLVAIALPRLVKKTNEAAKPAIWKERIIAAVRYRSHILELSRREDDWKKGEVDLTLPRPLQARSCFIIELVQFV